MFGYVRAFNDELKMREWNEYQAVYCGLCRTTVKHFGSYAASFLSYDITFLALLLDCSNETEYVPVRCILKPFSKKRMRKETAGMKTAAAVGIILTWHKLRDNVQDERGLKRLAAFVLGAMLNRAYRKAADLLPECAEVCEKCMKELRTVETAGERSMDRAADCFARMLAGAVPRSCRNFRSIEQIMYHTGRWIYLCDACDDFEKDLKSGAYNPVILNYGSENGRMSKETKENMAFTMENSLSAISLAYRLMEVSHDEGILSNIIHIGMYNTTHRILNQGRACEYVVAEK